MKNNGTICIPQEEFVERKRKNLGAYEGAKLGFAVCIRR